jgi:hypothetical protein
LITRGVTNLKKILFLFSLFLVFLLVAGCGSDVEETSEADVEDNEEETTEEDGEDEGEFTEEISLEIEAEEESGGDALAGQAVAARSVKIGDRCTRSRDCKFFATCRPDCEQGASSCPKVCTSKGNEFDFCSHDAHCISRNCRNMDQGTGAFRGIGFCGGLNEVRPNNINSNNRRMNDDNDPFEKNFGADRTRLLYGKGEIDFPISIDSEATKGITGLKKSNGQDVGWDPYHLLVLSYNRDREFFMDDPCYGLFELVPKSQRSSFCKFTHIDYNGAPWVKTIGKWVSAGFSPNVEKVREIEVELVKKKMNAKKNWIGVNVLYRTVDDGTKWAGFCKIQKSQDSRKCKFVISDYPTVSEVLLARSNYGSSYPDVAVKDVVLRSG